MYAFAVQGFSRRISSTDDPVRPCRQSFFAALEGWMTKTLLAANARAEAKRLRDAGAGDEVAHAKAPFGYSVPSLARMVQGCRRLLTKTCGRIGQILQKHFLSGRPMPMVRNAEGVVARDGLETLWLVPMPSFNQDNREHDILDSDDYYQFAGGLSAAVAILGDAMSQSITTIIHCLNGR